jgi:hypothetical protein
MQGFRRMAAALLMGATLATSACGEDQDDARKQETRRIMGEIFGGLRVALPVSVDPERFRAAGSRAEIAAALSALSRNAALLEQHAAREDEQMRFLARSVAADAREVERTYAAERYDRAAFLLRQIVENCVACHTRLRSDRDSPVSEGFVDSGVLEELPPEPRATLQIATRRFDEALATLEALFASRNEHPALMLAPLTDYLVVSLRVQGDYERPRATLQRFLERPDLWSSLRLDVERWIEALPGLEQRAAGKSDLPTARALLDEGKALERLPGDRAGLVHYVAASAVLERFISEHRQRDEQLAEAYYLLGLLEANIGRNTWVTPAPFLLEQAIRLAPQAPFARQAFALLEREILRMYEGADEEAISQEEDQRLRELRELVGEG